MNQIEAVKRRVELALPGARAVIDKPINPDGPWMLDCVFRRRVVHVEWCRHRGFGISSDRSHGFGEGPQEIWSGVEAAAGRVVALLAGKKEAATPVELSFKELRALRRLSQAELADRLDVSQAAVSELESNLSRSKLSTLFNALRALGAKLEVFAVLPANRAVKLKL
jgi:DNA-binding XRE family transcriptional regulator